jgi:hypothetical protein
VTSTCILQEILFVGIGNCVLRIDTTKVGRGKDFTVEGPVKCHLEKLIDGVRLVGKHDGGVTDLSISQWMSTRLASGSKDGTVCTKLTTFVIEYFAKLHSVDLNGTLSLLKEFIT